MNYEHLYNEIRFYLQSEKGDKERLQQESLRFISNENPLTEKLEIGVLLGYLGDPRILDPSSDAYWSRVEVSFLDLLVGKYLVTTQEWRNFYESEHYRNNENWTEEGLIWRSEERPSWGELAQGENIKDFVHPNQPVVGICFHEAQAFATHHNSRLLYFDERLDIIRGQERRVYPWGKDFGRGNANTKEEVLQRPSPVGIFIHDRTPQGIHDLVGNVAEWTSNQDEEGCCIHPGSWHNGMMSAWPKASMSISPNTRLDYLGFRLARELPEEI
jgi:formylglycine-generating enzyme required for sulfatase activity